MVIINQELVPFYHSLTSSQLCMHKGSKISDSLPSSLAVIALLLLESQHRIMRSAD